MAKRAKKTKAVASVGSSAKEARKPGPAELSIPLKWSKKESADISAILDLVCRADPVFVARLRQNLSQIMEEHPDILRISPDRVKLPTSRAVADFAAERGVDPLAGDRPSSGAADAGRLPATSAPPAAESADAGVAGGKEPDEIPSLEELTRDLPVDASSMAPSVRMPSGEKVCRAFEVHVLQMRARLGELREFIKHALVYDEFYFDDPGAKRQCALGAHRELADLLDQLHETIFSWLIHVGRGQVIHLDEEAFAAVEALASGSMMPRGRAPQFIVNAAVKYLAGIPNRGGVLAVHERKRIAEAGADTMRDRSGWPWVDDDGRELTADSEYSFDWNKFEHRARLRRGWNALLKG